MTDLSAVPPPPDDVAEPGMPRWVKVFGIVLTALVAVFAVVHLAGGGMQKHGASPPAGAPSP